MILCCVERPISSEAYMVLDTFRRAAVPLFALAVLAAIVLAFHSKIFLNGYDTVHHLQMIDQLARHAAYDPAKDAARIGDMINYPTGSYWPAALLAHVEGGYGLVAMSMIAVASVFLCYLMLGWIVQRDQSYLSLAIFALLVYALAATKTQIGWEIVWNFFYPQLVADLLLFGGICGLMLAEDDISIAAVGAPLLGLAAMSVQPIVAIHIMGSAIFYLSVRALMQWNEKGILPTQTIIKTFFVIVASAIVVLLHPAYRFMRSASNNDGSLVTGYPSIWFVVIPSAIVALVTVLMAIRNNSRTDLIIGSTLSSAIGLIILQQIALSYFGQGSPYAVKKHLFIITTLTIVSASRLIGGALQSTWKCGPSQLAGVVVASLITLWIAVPQLKPAAPLVSALKFADTYSSNPRFTPGDAYADDDLASAVENLITTMVGLKYPDKRKLLLTMAYGQPGSIANLVMVHRSPEIDASCDELAQRSDTFAIVPKDCLSGYTLGSIIKFGTGGTSGRFAVSGWSPTEAWGRWSVGKDGGKLHLAVPSDTKPLRLSASAFMIVPGKERTVRVVSNGVDVATWKFSISTEFKELSAEIPDGAIKGKELEIEFIPSDVVRPGGGDTRDLGIGLKSLSIVAR